MTQIFAKADRSDVFWHCKPYVIENVTMVFCTDVITCANRCIHGANELMDLFPSPPN